MKRLDVNLLRDRGAQVMLEIVQEFIRYDARTCDWFWETYRRRFRAEQEEAIEEQLKLVRFSLLHRAGRDADWIRSSRRSRTTESE